MTKTSSSPVSSSPKAQAGRQIKNPGGRRIQILSFDEAYELRFSRRTHAWRRGQRICGCFLGKKSGYCTNVAGAKTTHFGVGFCHLHPGSSFQEKIFRIQYLRIRATVQLEDILAGAEISDDDMGSLKAEVLLLSEMLKLAVARDSSGTFGPTTDPALITRMVSEIAKIKKTYAEIRALRLSVAPKQIEMFVEEVLRIVKAVAGEEAVLKCRERFAGVSLSFGKGAMISAGGDS